MNADIYEDARPVKVTGAPGYTDFDAAALAEVTYPDEESRTVVTFLWEGKREFAVVPTRCVSDIVS